MDRDLLKKALTALELMMAEFRALDLPYGSVAYQRANYVAHDIRNELENMKQNEKSNG